MGDGEIPAQKAAMCVRSLLAALFMSGENGKNLNAQWVVRCGDAIGKFPKQQGFVGASFDLDQFKRDSFSITLIDSVEQAYL
jgi:hypothetical protein